MSRALTGRYRLTRIDRVVMDAAQEVLRPRGFELSYDYGAHHPVIVATSEGRSYVLAYSNTPRGDETAQAQRMRQKARQVLAGAYRPEAPR